MFIALDENNNRVHIDNAKRDKSYFCPSCGSKLIVKSGDYKVHHFAHAKNNHCIDVWHYDMTEWHYDWQNKFPLDTQEIVKFYNGEKHRADVLLEDKKIVLEFQHSSLSSFEFFKRNTFYNKLGYKVVWLFDVRDEYDCLKIEESDKKENLWRWKYPRRTFESYNYKNKDVEIFLQFSEDFLCKVNWSIDCLSKFITGKSYSEETFVDLFIKREKVLHELAKSVFELWMDSFRVAIFRNVKTNKYIKILKNPNEQFKKNKRVFGYLSSDGYTYTKETKELYGVYKPEWICEWFKED
ncbi:MAG: hypothetical protein IKJ14_01460 [Clostridia bacterium]|nr:hypothetical protein [Clostridia bacterium]